MNCEKWDELRYYLSDDNQSCISEKEFEEKMKHALSILGWKEYRGDIQIRPSIPIGASNTMIPDFIINSSDKKNLFVIEIKQPNIPLSSRAQQQLFSYMRQLKLHYGLLIGSAIQVFYDGDLIDQHDPVLLETIAFDGDASKGSRFVELFSKEVFSEETLEEYTKDILVEINCENDKKAIEEKLLSSKYQDEVKNLIKQDLLDRYDAELISSVLENKVITISSDQQILVDQPEIVADSLERQVEKNVKDTTKYIINGSGVKLGKNKFVLALVKAYLQNNPQPYSKVISVFSKDLQGSIGVISKLEDVRIKYANKSKKRHFIKPSDVLVSSDQVEFVVCTEWGIGNVHNIVNLGRKLGFEVFEVKKEVSLSS